MCVKDVENWNALKRRRTDLNQVVLGRIFSEVDKDVVWVDGDDLRNFLSCREVGVPSARMVDKICCPHGQHSLHPRVARRGKLLPRSIFESYAKLRAADGGSEGTGDVTQISPDQICCNLCTQQYQVELRGKVQIVEAVLRLYAALDPKQYAFNFEISPSEAANESDLCAYVVARKFVSSFRARVARFLKSILTTEASVPVKDFAGGASRCETIVEGLDALELSSTLTWVDGSDEKRVNESITCMYMMATRICSRDFSQPLVAPIVQALIIFALKVADRFAIFPGPFGQIFSFYFQTP